MRRGQCDFQHRQKPDSPPILVAPGAPCEAQGARRRGDTQR